MNVIEVIPLIRGSQIDTLSYYSSQSLTVGQIITVPIRKQQKPALVITITPASAAKAALRAATFTLKKLPEQSIIGELPGSILAVAERLTTRVPATRGAILHALLPREIREGHILPTVSTPIELQDTKPEIGVLVGSYEDRFRTYRSRIRETFAHRGSVLFVLPTTADVLRAQASLESGIEKRVITFTPTLSKKKLEAAYEQFADYSRAKLIITTPSHLALDRHDITLVIVEQSRSRAYKNRLRPYLDSREVITEQAKLTGRNILLGDMVPRAEDEWRRRNDWYLTEGEVPKRLTLPSKLEVIHVPEDKSGTFSLFLPPVVQELEAITAKRKNVFVYAARRGIAPVVACVDCGYVFRCPDSGAPYTLMKTGSGEQEERWFVAAASGRRHRAADTCPICNSWRLRERGIGIQHIESDLKENFPNVPLVVFDHTTATSPKKAATLMSTFYETKGAILLGTAMAIPFIEKPVAYSVITSLDAARAIPTWRAEEELFSLLLTMREKTSEICYLQTRSEPDEVVRLATQGHLEAFCNEELTLRESLKYPPFSIIVHLTIQGPATALKPLEQQMMSTLHTWQPQFYSAPTSTQAKTTRYGLIKIPRHEWPNPKLINTLRGLPPQVRVEINPDRIV